MNEQDNDRPLTRAEFEDALNGIHRRFGMLDDTTKAAVAGQFVTIVTLFASVIVILLVLRVLHS